MLKIKKQLIVISCVIGTVCLQGCSAIPLTKNSSDSGQLLDIGTRKAVKNADVDEDSYEIVDRSMYLDTSVLDETTSDSKYETFVVRRGEFTTTYENVKGQMYFPKMHEIKAQFGQGTMIFEKFLVEPYQYVKAGDPVANVHIELDTTQENDFTIHLKRYEQRYAEAKKAYQSSNEIYKKKLQETMTTIERMKLKLEYEDFLNQWEKTEKDWIQTMKDTQEAKEAYETAASQKHIVAEEDGYVLWKAELMEGSELKDGTSICGIMKEGNVYVSVNNKNQFLSYGCPVKVTFGAKKITYPGTVVSLDNKTASADLYTDDAYIKVDCKFKDVYQLYNVTVSYVAQSMKNVLLVERDAVTLEDDIPYVKVQKEDGSICKTGFLAGGSNHDYYWVYSGLSEGMLLVK